MSITTYSLYEVAQSLDCSIRWLTEQIRSGRFRARKIGRSWRLTDDDIQFALEVCANNIVPVTIIESTAGNWNCRVPNDGFAHPAASSRKYLEVP